VVVRALDSEEDLVRELLDLGRQPAETRGVILLGEREKRRAYLFGCHDLADTQRARRPFRDAKLHLGKHGARSGFVVPGHVQGS
jgi:hypothetical protein